MYFRDGLCLSYRQGCLVLGLKVSCLVLIRDRPGCRKMATPGPMRLAQQILSSGARLDTVVVAGGYLACRRAGASRPAEDLVEHTGAVGLSKLPSGRRDAALYVRLEARRHDEKLRPFTAPQGFTKRPPHAAWTTAVHAGRILRACCPNGYC